MINDYTYSPKSVPASLRTTYSYIDHRGEPASPRVWVLCTTRVPIKDLSTLSSSIFPLPSLATVFLGIIPYIALSISWSGPWVYIGAGGSCRYPSRSLAVRILHST